MVAKSPADDRLAPVLLADVGGTHVRFALGIPGQPDQLAEVRICKVAEQADFGEAVQSYRRDVACAATSACFAVAGPVDRGIASLTNGHWRFVADELTESLGLRVHLVNDFAAQAHALSNLDGIQLEALGHHQSAPVSITHLNEVRLMVGPGTGVGIAAWHPQAGIVLPAEAGHADCAPGDALELELLGVLMQRFDKVSWEHVLTGRGLAYLYWAMGQLWGEAVDEDIAPEAVTAAALQDETPLAMHTLEIYCHWLGGFCANQAFSFMPRGGVFLSGAMIDRLLPYLRRGGFRRRFEERAALQQLMRSIPTFAVRDDNIGLKGAYAAYRRGDKGV